MKSFFRKVRHQAIIKNLQIPKEALVLDTSCQDGGFLSVLTKNNADKNLKPFGVDISESDISKAKKLVPTGIFEITDNKTLPFADKTFDVVISSLTLHHMNNPISSLLEMKRVIKDTGSIYLIDIMAEGKLFNSILKKIKCPEPYHFEKFYSVKEVEELVTKVGVKINTKKKVFVFPTFTITAPVSILELQIQE
ncbi:MAG TPA: class I SAM-dependent methyltransferase [Candidatus Paceibacterota bacterium]|nr:class I SAM-dependent methyltransferase [Candidatus Paceibacterota bacterium]